MYKKMLTMMVLAIASAAAAPVVGVSFGSNSGCCGNLNVTVTGLAPSEVLQAQIVYGIDTVYVDGRQNPGPFAQDFTQGVQLVSNGTFYLGTFGGQNYSSTSHDNLRYLHLSITSNVGGALGTWLVDPASGAAYVALGPVRNVSPSEVPEPATYAVVGAGLVAVALWKRGRCAEPPKPTEPVTNPYKLPEPPKEGSANG